MLAAGLVLALGGLVAGRVRRRASGQDGERDSDTATLLFTASAILILLPPALFATFDWRYELPQLSLIPIAAILGLTALGRRASDRNDDADALIGARQSDSATAAS